MNRHLIYANFLARNSFDTELTKSPTFQFYQISWNSASSVEAIMGRCFQHHICETCFNRSKGLCEQTYSNLGLNCGKHLRRLFP
jgi:hypothetical protein